MGTDLVEATNNPSVQYVPTTGTILVLNFAEVIQLTGEFYAPGSLGTFNLQLQVTVQNNQNVTWLGSEYDLVIMVMHSGVFVNERGPSSTFMGLLTEQDVLDALRQQPYSSNKVRRMVGGGFLGNIRSGLGWIQSKLPAVRGVLEHVPHQYAQTGANVLKALGYGKIQRPMDNKLALKIRAYTDKSLVRYIYTHYA
ncbi:MAG: major capsid protein V20 domain-containing protein, partial [Candidatus Fonsibacter sp.]